MHDTNDPDHLEEAIQEALRSSGGWFSHLGLVGDTTFGCEGLYGLRLVANCVWQAYEDQGAVPPVDPPSPPPSGPLARRLKKAKKRLAKIVKHAEETVVCYHLEGTGEWNLAYSPDLSLDDVWQMLETFLRHYMTFEW